MFYKSWSCEQRVLCWLFPPPSISLRVCCLHEGFVLNLCRPGDRIVLNLLTTVQRAKHQSSDHRKNVIHGDFWKTGHFVIKTCKAVMHWQTNCFTARTKGDVTYCYCCCKQKTIGYSSWNKEFFCFIAVNSFEKQHQRL